jgi:type IV secretion system protein VirB2
MFHIIKNKDLAIQYMMLLVLVLVAAFLPLYASAAEDEVAAVICRAINQMTGPIGKAIAVIVVISMAIMLFLGKVSWGLAIAVAVGMGILFGAEQVVQLLSNKAEPICPPETLSS